MTRRLITDQDVLDGTVASPLVLDDDTLVTPAARDRLCRLGIEVIDRRAGAPAPAPTACSAPGSALSGAVLPGACPRCSGGASSRCTCAGGAAGGTNTAATLDGLADGTYLVRIEGGRVGSIQAATGPGRMTRARGL